jgi:hypothetical protein
MIAAVSNAAPMNSTKPQDNLYDLCPKLLLRRLRHQNDIVLIMDEAKRVTAFGLAPLRIRS